MAVSVDNEEPSAALAVQETNSVEASTPTNSDSDERVVEILTRFATEYPELAETPLSETHGRKLRRICTEAEYVDRLIETENEFERAYSVAELRERSAATWLDAMSAFLYAHIEYEGLAARFLNNDTGEEFDVPLLDAWGQNYMEKQYARARALDRSIGGGERPSGGEAVASWSQPTTLMLTLTASSVPDGSRLLPVDHMDQIHDAFSYEGVRDTLRNVAEHHLSLDTHEWGYWLQAQPHGAGASADPDRSPGKNACYTHIHVGVYFDRDPIPYSDLEGLAVEFERVIDKHLDVCPAAGLSAHDYDAIDSYVHDDDGCISLNPDVENMGSYLASYLGGYDGDLLDRSVEYIAWGAIYWSAARRRTSRSQIINHAIKADACHQRAESDQSQQQRDHGASVRWNDHHGPDVVCSSCGSSWQIDQTRIEEPTSDDELNEALSESGVGDEMEPEVPQTLEERWPTATAAARVGERTNHARVRSLVEDHLDRLDHALSVPRLLGELNIDPRHAEFVRDLVNGDATDPDVPTGFERPPPLEDEFELIAIVDKDDEEHPPGEGGIDMQPLKLPVKHILENTRLGNDLARGEVFRNSKTMVSSHSAEIIANSFVNKGITDPEVVNSLLIVEDYHNNDRPCMRHPDEK